MVDKLVSSEIITVPNTDHKAVTSEYIFHEIKRGPSYWKFNNSLLKDPQYVAKINKLIRNHTEDQQYDPQLSWDYCKTMIREVTINHSRQKAKHRRDQIKQLQVKLKYLEDKVANDAQNEDSQQNMQDTKLALDILALQDAHGAQIRSRIKWIEEGEKNNKYFLSLEKRQYNSKIMTSLVDQQGNVISKQTQILEMKQNFYRNLYTQKFNLIRQIRKIY